MGVIYKITFTPEEIKPGFLTFTSFGVPMNQIKQFIALSVDQQKRARTTWYSKRFGKQRIV
jgi:hypothetical protein